MAESTVVKLARKAIEEYVKKRKKIKAPQNLSEKMEEQKGVFVSIKKNNQLRGCIGTISATQENVASEIINNAISACARDPRFPPVREDELEQLKISVDIIGKKEPVASIDQLDPQKYGVIVKRGNQKGLLLPDLEGINTAQEQVEIARRKAGISVGTEIDLFRFKVERYR